MSLITDTSLNAGKMHVKDMCNNRSAHMLRSVTSYDFVPEMNKHRVGMIMPRACHDNEVFMSWTTRYYECSIDVICIV